MESQAHLEIFTSNQIFNYRELHFHYFVLLPIELRMKIWRCALRRWRFIPVYLTRREEQTSTQSEGITESSVRRERFCANLKGCQVFSKFLRVNTESRDAALKFYRVHLPCTFLWEGTTRPGTLHLNPEHDFLQINYQSPVKDTLVDFLYHLKTTFDPRHVGLLNLAVDHNAICGYDLHALEPSDLESEVKTAFVETLTKLQEVFFVSIEKAGRSIIGPLSGLPTSETLFDRGVPIMATPPTFERLLRDPRSISQDLEKVFTGTPDLRLMRQTWLRLLKNWGISTSRSEYRFLISFKPSLVGTQISDRSSATRWLQQEDDTWRNPVAHDPEVAFGIKKFQGPTDTFREKVENEDLEKAVRPAFGFWLFPVDALGPLQEKGVAEKQGFTFVPKRMLDMTRSWPELGLLSLLEK